MKQSYHHNVVISQYKRFVEICRDYAIFQILGLIAIFIAAFSFWQEAKDQRKIRHYRAWQVINLAQGKGGAGGRIQALEELNRDGISLAGVDLSKAWLSGINLEKADLRSSDLKGAILDGANLRGAYCNDAHLEGADLTEANLKEAYFTNSYLQGANLLGAHLERSHFSYANLDSACLVFAHLEGAYLKLASMQGAILIEANMENAFLGRVNLGSANLFRADLENANLAWVCLDNAYLEYANLRHIRRWREIESINLANIAGVKFPPYGFMEWSDSMGAIRSYEMIGKQTIEEIRLIGMKAELKLKEISRKVTEH